MNKKLLIMSCLVLLNNQADARGFGGGFATGAIVGTGITLAATSGSRNANRDPYYEVDKMKARQEAEEIREETRLRKEEDRKLRKSEREKRKSEERYSRENRHNQYRKDQSASKNENLTDDEQKLKILELQLELKKLELAEMEADTK